MDTPADQQRKFNLTKKEILAKLNEMYDKEEALAKEIQAKMAEYQQVQEDKEMLQVMYMYQDNKGVRFKEWLKKQK